MRTVHKKSDAEIEQIQAEHEEIWPKSGTRRPRMKKVADLEVNKDEIHQGERCTGTEKYTRAETLFTVEELVNTCTEDFIWDWKGKSCLNKDSPDWDPRTSRARSAMVHRCNLTQFLDFFVATSRVPKEFTVTLLVDAMYKWLLGSDSFNKLKTKQWPKYRMSTCFNKLRTVRFFLDVLDDAFLDVLDPKRLRKIGTLQRRIFIMQSNCKRQARLDRKREKKEQLIFYVKDEHVKAYLSSGLYKECMDFIEHEDWFDMLDKMSQKERLEIQSKLTSVLTTLIYMGHGSRCAGVDLFRVDHILKAKCPKNTGLYYVRVSDKTGQEDFKKRGYWVFCFQEYFFEILRRFSELRQKVGDVDKEAFLFVNRYDHSFSKSGISRVVHRSWVTATGDKTSKVNVLSIRRGVVSSLRLVKPGVSLLNSCAEYQGHGLPVSEGHYSMITDKEYTLSDKDIKRGHKRHKDMTSREIRKNNKMAAELINLAMFGKSGCNREVRYWDDGNIKRVKWRSLTVTQIKENYEKYKDDTDDEEEYENSKLSEGLGNDDGDDEEDIDEFNETDEEDLNEE